MVGLAGWRAAVDRKAVAGVQPEPFGGRPVYVMPSTSGLNAEQPPRGPDRPPPLGSHPHLMLRSGTRYVRPSARCWDQNDGGGETA